MYSKSLELVQNLRGIFMNKLIATLIVSAFSVGAFAATIEAATPAKTELKAEMKTDAKPVVKHTKKSAKTEAPAATVSK
jgi:hypothetical protein